MLSGTSIGKLFLWGGMVHSFYLPFFLWSHVVGYMKVSGRVVMSKKFHKLVQALPALFGVLFFLSRYSGICTLRLVLLLLHTRDHFYTDLQKHWNGWLWGYHQNHYAHSLHWLFLQNCAVLLHHLSGNMIPRSCYRTRPESWDGVTVFPG